MTSSPGFTYTNDVLGNRTSKIPSVGEATFYNWDDVNRLVATGTYLPYSTAYKYRADGMRVSKLKVTGSVSTQTQATFYDGQMPVETVDFGTTNTVTRNFVGARGIEAIFTTTPTSDTTVYPLYDAHGNVTSTLSKAGNSYVNGNVRTYDVWGGVRTGAQTAGPNNRYCANLGHVQDDESGLIYMRARYYEPSSGRFISEDPGRQGANLFRYANSNPLRFSDPNGLDVKDPLEALAIIMRALFHGTNRSSAAIYAIFRGLLNRVDEIIGNALANAEACKADRDLVRASMGVEDGESAEVKTQLERALNAAMARHLAIAAEGAIVKQNLKIAMEILLLDAED